MKKLLALTAALMVSACMCPPPPHGAGGPGMECCKKAGMQCPMHAKPGAAHDAKGKDCCCMKGHAHGDMPPPPPPGHRH